MIDASMVGNNHRMTRKKGSKKMNSYSSTIGLSVMRVACVFVALGIGAAAYAQSLNIAVSNSSTQDNNVIYGVTATPQIPSTLGPPSLSLNVLPINPAPPAPRAYGGFNTIVYAPSTQAGASVDLIGSGSCCGPIYRFFGPTFSGTLGSSAPNAVQVWACTNNPYYGYTPTPCSGPDDPISMAVDGNGTLFVLSSDTIQGPGASPTNDPTAIVVELWAFPKSATSPSGFVSSPILVDPDVAGPGQHWSNGAPVSGARDYTLNNIDAFNGNFGFCDGSCAPDYPSPNRVMDLMIAPAGVAAPVSPNDVLVLFGDPGFAESDPVALVADYSATNLQAVLSYAGANPPWSVLATPLTVANANDFGNFGLAFIDGELTASDGGESAVSIAAWPATSNILMMTNLGNIYQFSWSATVGEVTTYQLQNPANFSQGALPLGCSSYGNFGINPTTQVATLRTGVLSGNSYAFVTQYTCGDGPSSPSEVLSLDGTNISQLPEPERDGPLAGLAVSGAAPAHGGTGTAQGCTGSGCNLTGGVAQTITGTPAAIAAVDALQPPNNAITENVCIVPQDPRHLCNKNAPPASGNPLYNSKTLPVKSVCPDSKFNPSFGNTVIPDYICGSYGSTGQGSGTGFVVIQGIAKGVDGIPGLLDYSDANPDFFFNTPPPPCSTTKPEPDILFGWAPWTGDTNVEGTIPEQQNMIELTYGCGSSKGLSSGMSLLLVGGQLNLNGVTEFKPGNLVSFAEFKYGNLLADVTLAPIDLPQKVRLLKIVTESELFLIDGKTECAARKLWRADKFVSDHAAHFHGTPGKDPNPYGRARSRLANLFFTLFSRIEGNAPPQTWPVSRPPGICVHNLDIDSDGY
jgi:hypothetical protein